MVWWLGLSIFITRARVKFLVGELRSHMPPGMTQKEKKKKSLQVKQLVSKKTNKQTNKTKQKTPQNNP